MGRCMSLIHLFQSFASPSVTSILYSYAVISSLHLSLDLLLDLSLTTDGDWQNTHQSTVREAAAAAETTTPEAPQRSDPRLTSRTSPPHHSSSAGTNTLRHFSRHPSHVAPVWHNGWKDLADSRVTEARKHNHEYQKSCGDLLYDHEDREPFTPTSDGDRSSTPPFLHTPFAPSGGHDCLLSCGNEEAIDTNTSRRAEEKTSWLPGRSGPRW